MIPHEGNGQERRSTEKSLSHNLLACICNYINKIEVDTSDNGNVGTQVSVNAMIEVSYHMMGWCILVGIHLQVQKLMQHK